MAAPLGRAAPPGRAALLFARSACPSSASGPRRQRGRQVEHTSARAAPRLGAVPRLVWPVPPFRAAPPSRARHGGTLAYTSTAQGGPWVTLSEPAPQGVSAATTSACSPGNSSHAIRPQRSHERQQEVSLGEWVRNLVPLPWEHNNAVVSHRHPWMIIYGDSPSRAATSTSPLGSPGNSNNSPSRTKGLPEM